jgi:RNA polymerase sporulation-specific sigma factor
MPSDADSSPFGAVEALLVDPIHCRLIEKIARKQTRGTSIAWEDAVQAAQLKILQALRAGKFRRGGRTEFYRWAATVARFEIIDQVRQERPCASLDVTREDSQFSLLEMLADSFNAVEALEQSDLVTRAIATIQKLDRYYPDRGYLKLWQGQVQGKTQTQLAHEVGITQGEVSKRWKELLRRLAMELLPALL